jgi:hypothetical protein
MLLNLLNSFDFDPLKIRKYLLSQGWHEEKTSKEYLYRFRRSDDPYSQIYVPKDRNNPSFKRGVQEVIESLKEIESRSEMEIIGSLLYPDNDLTLHLLVMVIDPSKIDDFQQSDIVRIRKEPASIQNFTNKEDIRQGYWPPLPEYSVRFYTDDDLKQF